ncbi:MAG: hypothetical protein RJA81_267 [Planctomycetota bacterium]
MLSDSFDLLAQVKPADGSGGSLIPLALMVGLVVVYYFLIVGLPQRRMQRERRNMLSALKKNDRVMTTGGIFGTVVSVDEKQDKVTVRICDEPAVRIQVHLRSVSQILKEDTQA